jgi:hypothetical protein
MERIPTYKISADGIDEDVDMIAITANPAIMVKGVKLSANTQKQAVLDFSDDERMIIAGPAMIPDMSIYRKDEDGEYNVVFTQEVILQLVEKFAATKSGSVFNVEHTDEGAPVFVMEHWIIEDPEMDKSKTFGFTDLPKGTWFIMAKVTSKKFWEEQVKNNEKFGFSIEGLLGLKLNRNQTMSKQKFVNALLEDGTKVYTPEFAVDQELFVIDENGDKAPIFNGEHKMEDGQVVVTVGGKITELKPKAEMAEEEVKEEEEEVKASEDEKETELEEVKEEEEVKASEEEELEEEVKVEAAEIDEAAILAIIQPKLDEIYAAIAELKGEMVDGEATEEVVELSAKDQFLANLNKIDQYMAK